MKWIVSFVATLAAWFRRNDAHEPEALLTHTDGVVLGCTEDGRVLVDWSIEPVMAFMPTRSGKNASVVIPTLLSWSESLVVLDIKGVCYRATSAYRSGLGDVVYFNPSSRAGMRWNPLSEIRTEEGVNHLVDVLLPAPQEGDDDFVAIEGGRDVLTATLLYVLKTHDRTLGAAFDLMGNYSAWFDAVEQYTGDRVDVFFDIVNRIETQDFETCQSWFNLALYALRLWRDPFIRHATSVSDFQMGDLQRKVLSLYVVIPAGECERYSTLVNVLLAQMARASTRPRLDKHRLLVVCDEMPMWGLTPDVVRSVEYALAYDVKWLMLCQGLEQIQALSQSYDALLGFSPTKLFHGGCSWMRGVLLVELGDELERAGLDEAQLVSLDNDQAIIIQEDQVPIKAWQVSYYTHPSFMDKSQKVDLPTSNPFMVRELHDGNHCILKYEPISEQDGFVDFCDADETVATEPVLTDVLLSIISKDQKGE